MADFFDQICKVILESDSRKPGTVSSDAVTAQFFQDFPKKNIPEKVPVVKSVPERPLPAEPVATARTEKVSVEADTLEKLCAILGDCRRCPLCEQRNNIVFGEGNPHAKLMFIGEGPGFDEDKQGRPFVGRAGELLNKMIRAMQFTREEVYIANIVKCRPPHNRVPMPDEVEKCLPFLKKQIDIIRPEVIVLLGSTAAKNLLNITTGISALRGRWTSFENIPVMPTFHPAYLLRNESAKKDAWQDLQKVMARFGKYHKA